MHVGIVAGKEAQRFEKKKGREISVNRRKIRRD
jgi:hypothetical protein